jgi:uncharacterized membrane protein
MTKNRLEAFSDGVIAIIITIMVLELKVPHHDSPADLLPLWPVFLSYILSFIYVGIYWNNHHHLLHAVQKIDGGVMWANMALLFTLSMIPFATAWMGENHFSAWPVALYGVALLACAIAYFILATTLVRRNGNNSQIARALGKETKEKVSVVIYLAAIGISLYFPWVACGLYLAVALLWLIPDRRIETRLDHQS